MDMQGIRNALEYPGQTIKDSFLYTHDRVYMIDVNLRDINDSSIQVGDKTIKYGDMLNTSNCSYIISYGANAALKYLQSKFKGTEVEIPVIYFQLKGYDIVYANYICNDGTIPATIVESKESSIKIYISPLPVSDVEILNETESIGVDYELCKMRDVGFDFLGKGEVYYYKCTHGPIIIEGEVYSCDSLDGENRLGEVVNQHHILSLACKYIFDELDVYSFIDRNINDRIYRKVNNKILTDQPK